MLKENVLTVLTAQFTISFKANMLYLNTPPGKSVKMYLDRHFSG